MSKSGEKQGQSQLLPSVPVDKTTTDYHAETAASVNNHDRKPEDETSPPTDADRFATRRKLRQFARKMYFVFKEAAIMLFLALTYAALTNDPPRISKSPAAYPFFSKSSVITDWYRGQLSAAIDRARESDIAFVMFYAPWDAESQTVRQEFDLTARYMQKQITFAAVNCWQPGSECRRQYNKAYNWPVLIAYPSHGKGIQYKGPRTAAHMVKFLTGLSRPLMRLSKQSEVHNLLASYDAVILGCVNALPGSYEYAVLYTAALYFLEKDPFQEVAFAVLTGQQGECFDETGPLLTLHMWNETLLYPTDEEWKPDALLSWILKNLHQVSMWITPLGSKSLALSTYIQPGPALILFTPRNALDSSIDYYDMLHEVALEYYNCEDKNQIMLNSLLIHTKRIENYLKYAYLLKTCPLKTTDFVSFPSVVTFTAPKKWANSSCCLSGSKLSKDSCSKCDSVDLLKDRLPDRCKNLKLQEECMETDQGWRNMIRSEDIHRICDDHVEDAVESNIETSMLNDEYDHRLPKNLQKLWKKEKCRIAGIARKTFPVTFSETITMAHLNSESSNGDQINISGLACKTNASLTLIALDSLQFFHFAERLGMDLSTKKDKTAAIIINEKMETHHVMQEPLNDRTLREFILNFTSNGLTRAFSSVLNTKSKYTHTYPTSLKSSTEFCLLELTTENFLSTVIQQDKAMIVLYYSKQCSFCSGISYTLLTTAKIFSSISSLQFTRIDGDLNTLPWEFTMDSYPTIIFFPARRKSESRVFPQDMPITVPNLISFILVNADSNLKLQVMWTLCNQTKFNDEKQSCMASVRAENLSLIENTLRTWRKANLLTKTKLLYRLQQLRNINLLLAHSPQDTERIQKHMTVLHLTSRDLLKSEKDFDSKQGQVRDEL